MAQRRTKEDERAALRRRVVDLEGRVNAVERALKVKPARAPAPRPTAVSPKARRCPGCLLEVPKGARGVRCVWCGFRFDAVPPLQPTARPPRRKR